MQDEPEQQDTEQPFMSHLVELRSRLLKAVAAVLLVFLGLVPFANRLYALLAEPLTSAMPEGAQMVAIEVVSPFLTPVKLAFFTALFVCMPVLIYQAWAFVAPGLYRHEKRLAVPLLVTSCLLFYVGCAFAYYLVMPVVFGFLQGIAPENVAVMTDISHFLDFALVLFFAFGACFEIPVAVIIVVMLGWVTPEKLVEARPYVIVGAFFIGAIFTPPDVISQIMLAVPMWFLFEVGIVASRALLRDRSRRDGANETGQS